MFFKFVLLPCIVLVLCCASSSSTDLQNRTTELEPVEADSGQVIAEFIKNVIGWGLSAVKSKKTLNITNEDKQIFNGKWLIVGTLKIGPVQLYGLDSLNYTVVTSYNTTGQSYKVNIALNFAKIGLNVTTYDCDIGILETVPLYGKGNFDIGLSKATADLDLDVSYKNYPILKSIYVNLRFREMPIKVTGLLNNEYADEIFGGVFNALSSAVTLIWAYENECFSCVISAILKSAIDNYLGTNMDGPDTSACVCDSDSTGSYRFITENIQPFISALINGNIEGYLKTIDNGILEEKLQSVVTYMTQLINEEMLKKSTQIN